jgi:hypothetical protein
MTPIAVQALNKAVTRLMHIGCESAVAEGRYGAEWVSLVDEARALLAQQSEQVVETLTDEREAFEAWFKRLYIQRGFVSSKKELEEAFQAGRALLAGSASADKAPDDSAILDWLETKIVQISNPARHGSRHLFHATLDLEDEKSDLREKVRERLKGQQ